MNEKSEFGQLEHYFPSLDFPPERYLDLVSLHRQISYEAETKSLVLLTNTTINPLIEILETFLWSNKINIKVTVGNYDNIVQDSVNQKPENRIIIFWELWNIFPNLISRIEQISKKKYQEIFSKLTQDILFTLNNLRQNPLVMFNRFSVEPFSRADGSRGRFEDFVLEANAYLDSLKEKFPNLQLIDIDQIHAFNGRENTIDTRYIYNTSSIYTFKFYKHYSAMVSLALSKHYGDVKKVLVLDCDNTLWGGIIGEDGPSGIQISADSPTGAVFNEVQTIYKAMGQNGALICLCTKNNKSDLDQVFSKQSDMVLSYSDIIRTYANWENKVENIRKISKDLNLGMDSFVFVDDSDFEIGSVKSELPEVTCVQVPKKLDKYVSIARSIRSMFGTDTLTKEDTLRTQMYKAEIARDELKNRSGSINDYLKSLSMTMVVYVDDKTTVPRAAQMTQKTNQFNLTTRRLSESETLEYVESKDKLLVCFELKDVYGDSGITGASFLSFLSESSVNIDNILLSCRVLGRNAEIAFMEFIINFLSEMKISNITAQFIPTSKNEQVEPYYEKLGFEKVCKAGGAFNYAYKISSTRKQLDTHIQIMRENNGKQNYIDCRESAQ